MSPRRPGKDRPAWTNPAPGRLVDEPRGVRGHAQGERLDEAREELAGEWLKLLESCERDGQRFIDVVGNYLKRARRENSGRRNRWRRGLITTGEAAMLAGCSQNTIIRQCRSGELACHRIGTFRRIAFSDFVAWARAKGIPLPEGLTAGRE